MAVRCSEPGPQLHSLNRQALCDIAWNLAHPLLPALSGGTEQDVASRACEVLAPGLPIRKADACAITLACCLAVSWFNTGVCIY